MYLAFAFPLVLLTHWIWHARPSVLLSPSITSKPSINYCLSHNLVSEELVKGFCSYEGWDRKIKVRSSTSGPVPLEGMETEVQRFNVRKRLRQKPTCRKDLRHGNIPLKVPELPYMLINFHCKISKIPSHFMSTII